MKGDVVTYTWTDKHEGYSNLDNKKKCTLYFTFDLYLSSYWGKK